MRFVIHKSRDDQYYFVIKASNGEIVATSETYVFKSSALSTIESMKKGINSESQVIDVSD
ncbi:YegP family protein [Staphylococcus delphini]|uniref:YegP family protein n=1 Tax=Staphylococcus delphini TaxID=53344 RepID=UPI000BBB722B|nr:YegP family protein [Staphylococcus delphini]PCF44216.1 DUF1508 domain-containing protein [Staphylococcus delphini]HBB6316658.1 DUF1508 domain-containing protein [Escherichia coli]HEC2198552.1 DUF1508 domain-containing protein [Staphylococcus delphini]HEC2213233.1 DUF1508 domain-containing protein [Staphylococcus delphini]